MENLFHFSPGTSVARNHHGTLVFWTLVGLAFIVWLVLVLLFTPRIDYHVAEPMRPDSDEFLQVIQSACLATLKTGNRIEVLTNGSQFYPAMREAICCADTSINLEAYIFMPGETGDMMIAALTERARAGVEVRIVLDAIGSSALKGASLQQLRDAGCQVNFYQRLTWYRLHRINNRTHRELLVVDGRIAFTGGAGVADWWAGPQRDTPAWRDTMARIEGPVVASLQGVFSENWLECCGEILTGVRHWPPLHPIGSSEAMVLKSSPADRATTSRIMFQLLMEGAGRDIDICTPYFLPDRALRRTLCRAARRGVRIRVIVPGRRSDQRLVRLVSRRMYGELVDAGVRIFEYSPSMTHAKTLMVDGLWAVLGTTNVDNRSFEHNDEVNVAFRDPAIVDRLRIDFTRDLQASEEITCPVLHSRSLLEKAVGAVCWIFERQQ